MIAAGALQRRLAAICGDEGAQQLDGVVDPLRIRRKWNGSQRRILAPGEGKVAELVAL